MLEACRLLLVIMDRKYSHCCHCCQAAKENPTQLPVASCPSAMLPEMGLEPEAEYLIIFHCANAG